MERDRRVSLVLRTSNSIDFLQVITIIYINNNFQHFGRGKRDNGN